MQRNNWHTGSLHLITTNEDILGRSYRDDDDVFLRMVGEDLLGGSEGPWTTADSASLSSPKLVMNSTAPVAVVPGDLDLDRDDESLWRQQQ